MSRAVLQFRVARFLLRKRVSVSSTVTKPGMTRVINIQSADHVSRWILDCMMWSWSFSRRMPSVVNGSNVWAAFISAVVTGLNTQCKCAATLPLNL